ncbi:MAG: hypothetical protein ABR538_07070 [Candidatus Binatia bacterium]
MSPFRIAALLLILGGGLGLAYGSFSFTKETHETKIGPLEFSIEEKERVNIPQWIAVAALGGGILLMFADRRRA